MLKKLSKKDQVWEIRKEIQELENIKDQILQLFTDSPDLDANAKKMWGGDTKEGYFTIVAAWELLNGIQEKSVQNKEIAAKDTAVLLDKARSDILRSASELKGLKNVELETTWKQTFLKCYASIFKLIAPFLKKKVITQPIKRIIKINDTEYQLLCSLCGEVSVVIRIGIPTYEHEQRVIIDGIVTGNSVQLANAPSIFVLLEVGDLKGLHELIKTLVAVEGVDAYCPECDEIYCRDHYNTYEEYDEGFYDCTYGTCPQGHRRMIDD